MYDFAHPIQDALEGVTHSLCSLEYEAHRPLYNWVVDQCEFEHKPRQIEFARLNITNTVMSKRYLRMMVESGAVRGWDDPRMPTLCAMRRRGYPAEAIKDFLARAGVAKADSVVDAAMLEHCVRENLNLNAARAMAVSDPVKLVIENWEEGRKEDIEIENLPVDGAEDKGSHTVPFGREVYIERDDFMIDPPKKFFRLKPDGEVRLKGAYIVKCTGYETDDNGRVTLIRAEYDPESRSGECTRKVKGTIHWVPVSDAVPAEFRIYEPLFTTAEIDNEHILESIDPNSIRIMHGYVEPFLKDAKPGVPYQFMRVGYFTADLDSREDSLVFNRTVGLKDSYKPQN
jgi:glutaminyl-tRNA synthetase